MIPGLSLGAPGIYQVSDEPLRALTGVRMDVCAFLGVAPRGPARQPFFVQEWAPKACGPGQTVQVSVPVAVESWDAYVRLYGGYEGPGLLPYAVSAFFQNGGKRAYVVRIVHQYRKADGSLDEAKNTQGIALGKFEGLAASGGREVWLRARNEGRWGNALQAGLSFTARPVALGKEDFFPNRIRLPQGFDIEAGAVLRLALGNGVKVIRRISLLAEDRNPVNGTREVWAYFDAPTANAALSAELVEATLTATDGINPPEILSRIGLSSNHSRWLAAVLVNESSLLYPAGEALADWLESDLVLDAALKPYATLPFEGGEDRYADIVPDDFFDADWILGDECPGVGVHSLVEMADVSLLAAPDLYSPGLLAPFNPILDSVKMAGAEFAECVPAADPGSQATPPDDLYGLRLDPLQDLDKIAALQRRLTELAEQLESFVVLLDVPPGLSQNKIIHWRSKFTSAYCAAYHPWLNMAPAGDLRGRLIAVNPSAVAAGIIAQRENRFGVMFGPANELAVGVVSVVDSLSAARHNALHQQAVNIFLPERDGIRLTAGRTLALDQTWRQLNVRRLVTMIRRVLDRQMQWAVFEPNNRQLRADISLSLEAFLRQLYRANAFTGDTEAQAFFVKCDDELNPPALVDQGRLLAQVGIAPAEPLEFIVLNIARSADSSLTVES